MPNHPRPSRLTRSCVAALVGASAWSASPLAHAQTGGVSGQKPPCVPASSYTLAYDCELFPLPSAAAPAAVVVAPAGVAVAVVPAGAAVAVVPVPDGGDAAAPVAAPVAVVAVADVPVAVVAVPASSGATPGASSDSSSDSPSHAPAYVAFAVGAAGIGMTVAFGILALQNKSTLSGECPGNTCPSSASSTVSSLSTNGDLADVGLGIAVAGVAVGAILFATEHKSSATTGKRHVEPWIGLGAGGFKGTF